MVMDVSLVRALSLVDLLEELVCGSAVSLVDDVRAARTVLRVLVVKASPDVTVDDDARILSHKVLLGVWGCAAGDPSAG